MQRDSDLFINARIITETKFETIICDNFNLCVFDNTRSPASIFARRKKIHSRVIASIRHLQISYNTPCLPPSFPKALSSISLGTTEMPRSNLRQEFGELTRCVVGDVEITIYSLPTGASCPIT